MGNHLRLIGFLTRILDTEFKIFNFRFGLDPLLGLIPFGLGDMMGLFLSGYIVWVAAAMKVPRPVIATMVANVAFDFVLGAIPFVGNIGDFVFRANTRNWELLKQHAKQSIPI